MSQNPSGASGQDAPGRGERVPRWGLRTLAFLALAMVSMITAQASGGYTIGSLGSLLMGLIGAGICSVKGWRLAARRGVAGLLAPDRGRRNLFSYLLERRDPHR